jgi:hypothetical protein
MSGRAIDGIRQGMTVDIAQIPGMEFIIDLLAIAPDRFQAGKEFIDLLYPIYSDRVPETTQWAQAFIEATRRLDNIVQLAPEGQKALLDLERRLTDVQKPIEISDLQDAYQYIIQPKIKQLAPYVGAAMPDRVKIFSDRVTDKDITEFQLFSGAILGNPYYKSDKDDDIIRKVNDFETLEYRDAGTDFNLPFPPLLRPGRNVDVIIAFDSSPDIETLVKALENGCKYAERNNHTRFPYEECLEIFEDDSKKNGLVTTPFTVLGLDESGNAKDDKQIVIFIPLKKLDLNKIDIKQVTVDLHKLGYSNEDLAALQKDYARFANYNPHNTYTITTNFLYEEKQVDELADFARLLGHIATPAIFKAIESKLKR